MCPSVLPSVPVSHDSMTDSQYEEYQDTKTKADNSAIIHFTSESDRKKWNMHISRED